MIKPHSRWNDFARFDYRKQNEFILHIKGKDVFDEKLHSPVNVIFDLFVLLLRFTHARSVALV